MFENLCNLRSSGNVLRYKLCLEERQKGKEHRVNMTCTHQHALLWPHPHTQNATVSVLKSRLKFQLCFLRQVILELPDSTCQNFLYKQLRNICTDWF